LEGVDDLLSDFLGFLLVLHDRDLLSALGDSLGALFQGLGLKVSCVTHGA
jgi:hypothetical protein